MYFLNKAVTDLATIAHPTTSLSPSADEKTKENAQTTNAAKKEDSVSLFTPFTRSVDATIMEHIKEQQQRQQQQQQHQQQQQQQQQFRPQGIPPNTPGNRPL